MTIFMYNHRRTSILSLITFLVLLNACTNPLLKPTAEEVLLVKKYAQSLGSDCTDFRIVSGEFKVVISDMQALTGDSLKRKNIQQGLPVDTPPSLKIWSADIVDYPTQKMLDISGVEPQPDTVFSDSEYANRILHWNLDSHLNSGDVTLSRHFKYLTFDYRPMVDSKAEHQNWHIIPKDISDKYTRSERFLEQDDALVDTVFTLLENIPDPVSQAEAIYQWIRQSMSYVYPPQERGVRNALQTLEGDCGQYTALYITMARIAGIPARQQSGFNFVEGNTGAHVWSEIYLPLKGWVPVDATREDGFLHLDNKRIIASIGLNIPLAGSPDWASFENSEVEDGKTDFMQMYTLASSGISASFSSSRTILRSVKIK